MSLGLGSKHWAFSLWLIQGITKAALALGLLVSLHLAHIPQVLSIGPFGFPQCQGSQALGLLGLSGFPKPYKILSIGPFESCKCSLDSTDADHQQFQIVNYQRTINEAESKGN